MASLINHLLIVAEDSATLEAAEEACDAMPEPVSLAAASTVAEARLHLAQHAPDAIIGYWRLPDGLLTDLRASHDGAPTCPLLPLAAYEEMAEAAAAMPDLAGDLLPLTEAILAAIPYLAERFLIAWQQQQHLSIAEAELSGNEQRLQALTGSTSDFIWEVDENAIYTYVSPQVQAMLGYTPSEVLGRTAFDFMPPAEAERLAARFRQIAGSGRPIIRWQNTVRHKDGRLVVLETSGMPILDDQGHPRGFRGIDRDVTHRQRAEQVLRRRDAILQAVAGAAQALLQATAGDDQIDAMLHALGTAAEVSRVYIFANDEDEAGELLMCQRHEWAAPGIPPEIDNPLLQRLPYAPDMCRWRDAFLRQEPIHGNIADFPPAEQAILAPQQIRSVLVVPIFVGDLWWGFIGFDECREARDWSSGEIDALSTAARILGADLQRRQWEGRLRQINQCFVRFGPDPLANINRVTELCGRLFNATATFYSRLAGNLLHTWGRWSAPPELPASDRPEGHVCYDAIRQGGELYVADLQASAYAETDPAVALYGLHSYFGRAVKCRGQAVGALCAVFQRPFQPTEDDRQLLAIMASAIGVEEERRAAEAEQRQLAAAIVQAAEAVCITDLDGTILYVNPAYERACGRPQAELLGSPMPLLFAKDMGEDFTTRLWQTLQAGEVWNSRIETSLPDQSIRHDDALISPIRDADGQIVSYAAVMRDISKELGLEQQLRHSQKMESIGRLAGGVAHDFNNLLSVILGYADMALANVDEGSPLQEMVVEIKQAGERATDLTRQLLAFSRKQVLEMKHVNLSRAVDDMRKMLGRLIGEDIVLDTQLAPDLLRVKADPSQIQQILMNLVVNARDAIGGNGIITIETQNAMLGENDLRRPPDLPPGPYVMLRVADTGHGMDEDTIRRIFDPFFTTKETGKGTGLGLATVHGIVKQHGGDIQVNSILGKGAAFTIYLAAEPEDESLGHTTIIDKIDTKGTETILLVEDDYNVLSLSRRILERYGYDILPADGAQAALRLADSHGPPIDLLLTDVVMPQMNGPDLAAELQTRFPKLRTLYMSGYADTVLTTRGILKEGTPLLGKPFTVAALTRAVRHALDASK